MEDKFIETQVAKEIFGIDPGRSNGGIVKWNNGKYESWPLKKMNDFETMCDFFADQKEQCKLPLVFLERITSFAGDYNDPKMKGRMFQMNKLKDHYVELKSALKVSKIPYIEVMPAQWQKLLKIHIPNEETAVRKRRLKDCAIDMYPGNNIVGWNADAFHLIEFGRMKLKYDLRWVLRKMKENPKPKTLFNG